MDQYSPVYLAELGLVSSIPTYGDEQVDGPSFIPKISQDAVNLSPKHL